MADQSQTGRNPSSKPQTGAATHSQPEHGSSLRVAVLVSGRGSNLQAIIDSCATGDLRASVVLVASNRQAAPAVLRAHEAGIKTCVADRTSGSRRKDRQDTFLRALKAADVDLVVLAGYDEVLLPEFVAAYAGRIINTHPSLLPAFSCTMEAVQKALDHGVKITGCTVHLVTADLDAGPILLQRAVELEPDDTVETLHARIRTQENKLLPLAIQAFAENRVLVDGTRARIIPIEGPLGSASTASLLVGPPSHLQHEDGSSARHQKQPTRTPQKRFARRVPSLVSTADSSGLTEV